MADFLDLPTLVIIGIAVLVLLRLRSVLGTRTGNERRPPMPARPDQITPEKDEKVIPLRPRDGTAAANDGPPEIDRRALKLEVEIEQFSHGSAEIAAGLQAIAELDPAFGPKFFIEGAKSAYEMIVTAFAAGDRKALRNLLEKDVYDGFERAIIERESKNQKIDFTFVSLPKIEITEAEGDKRNVQITLRFNAEIVSATRDAEGTLIEGNADQIVTIADEWTFARNPRSRDPNWKLVATNQVA